MSITALDEQIPSQQFAADARLFVQFYMRPEKLGFKSEEQGRPIFEDRHYVRIMVPGDKNTVIDTEVTEQHKERFPKAWEKFCKQHDGDSQVEGTPLEEWPQLTTAQVQEFRAINIATVEQIAELTDAAVQRFMGGNILRIKAQAFIKVATDTAAAQKFAVENDELKKQIADLLTAVTRLTMQVELMQNANVDAPSAPPHVRVGANERTGAVQTSR